MNPTYAADKSSINTKQREYLKQQHQLRTMTKSSTTLSADDMIENLLSRKEIFQKKRDSNPQLQQHQKSSIVDPVWLAEGNEPSIFRKIWDQVCTPTGLADTPTLSYILLGSGLGTDTLGYIWSLTNTTVSGSLTKLELFRTLALIALAQKGYSFTNLLVLNQFHEAPVPRLDLRPSVPFMPSSSNPVTIANNQQTQPPPGSGSTSTLSIQQPPLQVPTVTETLSLLDTLTVPMNPAPITSSAPSSSLSILSATDLNKLTVTPSSSTTASSNEPINEFSTTDNEDDEFDDFKSADIFSTTDSLTVLDVKDKNPNTINLPEIGSNDDLFKTTNIPTFAFPVDKKTTLLDDIYIPTGDEEKNQPSEITNTGDISKKETSTVFSTSSLQEALREDLTLAPVSLSCLASSINSSGPVESDRYNALRQLAATSDDLATNSVNITVPQNDSYDDYGDFITAAQQPSSDSSLSSYSTPQSDLQEKCLEACVHVLREANDLFKSIDDPKVLAEVIGDDRGKRYLEEIVEVERIGRRIASSKSVLADDCELSKQLESLCKTLEPFTKPMENSHMEEEKGAKCGLCLCEIGPAHVKYGMNQFHAPCANLFLHVTGELLPLTPVT